MEDLLVILVVEDDPIIQTLVAETLADAGFEVAVASSGEEAVTFLNGDKVKYRALVTDINLPGGLTGWEIARTARELDPLHPVIYMTGAAGNDWAANGVPNSVLLAKPFAPAQLVTAVAQLLNAIPSTAPG